jgi:hypothetical protein
MQSDAAQDATAYCLQQGLEVYIQDAAQLLQATHQAATATPTANSDTFMAQYLIAVVRGEHVLWRHYEFVSGMHDAPKGCAGAFLWDVQQGTRSRDP